MNRRVFLSAVTGGLLAAPLAADGSIWASVLNAKTGAMNEDVIDLPPCADSARR